MTTIADKIIAREFVITSELTPPKGIDLAEVFSKAEALKGYVDAFNLTESPRARMAIAPSAVARLLLDRALAIGRESAVDEIVLALPWTDTRKLELVRDRLRVSPLPVQLVPDRRIRALAENPSYRLRRSLSIEIQRGPLSRAEQFSKRVVDIVGASLGLIILAPLMILSAIAIKLDSAGPIFFRQRRNGFNAKQFSIFKFRTMTVMEDGARTCARWLRQPQSRSSASP